jgi:hypothetical protein
MMQLTAMLAVWPYRALGKPEDEKDAERYWHKHRLSAPGLTAAEREASRKFLQRLGYYPWLTPFKKEKK